MVEHQEHLTGSPAVLETGAPAPILPSSFELQLADVDNDTGLLRVNHLYDFLADRTLTNNTSTHRDQLKHLHPGVLGKGYSYDRAWNTTIVTRHELIRQLTELDKGVSIEEVEDVDGFTHHKVKSNGNSVNGHKHFSFEELLMHAEEFGVENSPTRIIADLIFPRSMDNRSVQREMLFEEFEERFKQANPESVGLNLRLLFNQELTRLAHELARRNFELEISGSKRGRHVNQFIRVSRNGSSHKQEPNPSIEAQSVKPEEIKNSEGKNHPSILEGRKDKNEDQKPLDTMVFGVTKTEILQYFATANQAKGRSIADISVIRRREKHHQPVTARENETSRLILGTLGLELPRGIELRNVIDQEGNPIPDKFYLFPERITVKQIIDRKKAEQQAQQELIELKREEETRIVPVVEKTSPPPVKEVPVVKEQPLAVKKVTIEPEIVDETTSALVDKIFEAIDAPEEKTMEVPDTEITAETETRVDDKEVTDGKIRLNDTQLLAFTTIMNLTEVQAMNARKILETTQKKFKKHELSAMRLHLDTLKEKLKDTPFPVRHPALPDGTSDQGRAYITIPEGVNPLEFIDFNHESGEIPVEEKPAATIPEKPNSLPATEITVYPKRREFVVNGKTYKIEFPRTLDILKAIAKSNGNEFTAPDFSHLAKVDEFDIRKTHKSYMELAKLFNVQGIPGEEQLFGIRGRKAETVYVFNGSVKLVYD